MLFSLYFFFSSRRRHTRSVSAFLLNRSSDLDLVGLGGKSAADNHEYPFLYQRQTCHQVQPNQATYQKRQKCQPATRSEERRVGKECRSRWQKYAYEKKKNKKCQHETTVSDRSLLHDSQ